MTAGRRPRDVWFVAVTWNLRYSVRAGAQRPTIRRCLDAGVGLFFLQEFEAAGIAKVFRDEGLRVAKADRRAVVWDPDIWAQVQRKRGPARRLARRAFTRWPSGGIVNTDAAEVVLEHRRTGYRLLAISIHTPSGIQRGGTPSGRRDGLAVLREAMLTIGRVVRAVWARVDAVVVAGDDNADERPAPKLWARFNGRRLTGLRQVQAPNATHGGRRRIDDFRIRGLNVGEGWTWDTPGDHDLHARRLGFGRRTPRHDARRLRGHVTDRPRGDTR